MLEIDNLTVEYKSDNDNFYILRDLSLFLNKGEILGIAGESGSGKSILTKAVLGLLKKPISITKGSILLDNSIIKNKNDFKNIRGKKVSIIFQNPQSSLNPVMTVGSQIIETIKLYNKNISKKDAKLMALKLLKDVELDNPEHRLNQYPHQMSGGMNQRIMIAIALASNPEILIADEPTTALDVTIQKQIIDLIKKLNKEKGLTVLFISHDLSLLTTITNRIAVMYNGELMEIISSYDLKKNREKHPYTNALKNCIPVLHQKGMLTTIKGNIKKNDFSYNEKCIFADRCNYVEEICLEKKPVFKNNCKCALSL